MSTELQKDIAELKEKLAQMVNQEPNNSDFSPQKTPEITPITSILPVVDAVSEQAEVFTPLDQPQSPPPEPKTAEISQVEPESTQAQPPIQPEQSDTHPLYSLRGGEEKYKQLLENYISLDKLEAVEENEKNSLKWKNKRNSLRIDIILSEATSLSAFIDNNSFEEASNQFDKKSLKDQSKVREFIRDSLDKGKNLKAEKQDNRMNLVYKIAALLERRNFYQLTGDRSDKEKYERKIEKEFIPQLNDQLQENQKTINLLDFKNKLYINDFSRSVSGADNSTQTSSNKQDNKLEFTAQSTVDEQIKQSVQELNNIVPEDFFHACIENRDSREKTLPTQVFGSYQLTDEEANLIRDMMTKATAREFLTNPKSKFNIDSEKVDAVLDKLREVLVKHSTSKK